MKKTSTEPDYKQSFISRNRNGCSDDLRRNDFSQCDVNISFNVAVFSLRKKADESKAAQIV